jgi:hypothetical protein
VAGKKYRYIDPTVSETEVKAEVLIGREPARRWVAGMPEVAGADLLWLHGEKATPKSITQYAAGL